MEKGYEKYGKKYKTIVQLKDFADIKLNEQLYIKFHGDLNYPESIVFTTEDYEKRMDEQQNALNIRLRADLLAKNLLFIGYSFRDINIQQMFAELQKAFYGELPKSYLIAYKYSNELQLICNQYGIELIDPLNEFPEAKNNVEAFNLFLQHMLEDSRIKKVDEEIKEFFTPVYPRPIKVVSKMELDLLEKVVEDNTFTVGIDLFREICDASNIPLDYEKRIASIFIKLAQKVKTDKQTDALNSAIFNLKITNPLNRLEIVAALMATSNVRESKDKHGTDTFFISSKYSIEKYYIVLAAKAIENVYSWGWEPTPPLVWNVGRWIDRSADIKTLPEQAQQYVAYWVDKMRSDCRTVAEHPIKRQQRLQSFSKDNFTNDDINLLLEVIKL